MTRTETKEWIKGQVTESDTWEEIEEAINLLANDEGGKVEAKDAKNPQY